MCELLLISATNKCLGSNKTNYDLCRLISQLEERVKVVSEEISSLEGVDKRAEELLVKVSRLNQALANIRVWAQDDQETERKITVRERMMKSAKLKLSPHCVELIAML